MDLVEDRENFYPSCAFQLTGSSDCLFVLKAIVSGSCEGACACVCQHDDMIKYSMKCWFTFLNVLRQKNQVTLTVGLMFSQRSR